VLRPEHGAWLPAAIVKLQVDHHSQSMRAVHVDALAGSRPAQMQMQGRHKRWPGHQVNQLQQR
jgi:purine nucleoside phosphorylase